MTGLGNETKWKIDSITAVDGERVFVKHHY